MVKEISDKLKKTSDKVNRKITDSRLANKFQSFFKKFQKASQLAAEAESVYPPLVTQEASSSHTATDVDTSTERSEENHSLLVEYKRMEGLVVLENDISSNEAETEERWKAIEEIQYQIGEIKAIYNDLAVVVHEQGTMNYGIDSYGARNAAYQGKKFTYESNEASKIKFLYYLLFGDFWFSDSHCDPSSIDKKIKQLQ